MKCLKTQLKGSINNDNLPVLGSMLIHVNAIEASKINPDGSSQKLTINLSEGELFKLKPLNGGYYATTFEGLSVEQDRIYDERVYQAIKSNMNIYVPNMDFDILLVGKYEIRTFVNNTDNNKFRKIITIDSNELMNFIKLNTFYCANSFQTGDLEYFKNCTELTHLSIYNSRFTGNISSLVNNRKLTILYLTELDIKGKIETLVATQYDDGHGNTRTSGTITITNSSGNTDLTLKGVTARNEKITFETDRCTIYDNSNNVLCTYDGTHWHDGDINGLIYTP